MRLPLRRRIRNSPFARLTWPFEGHTRQITLVTPLLQQLREGAPAVPIAAEQGPFRIRLAFVVEVARRAEALEIGQVDFQRLEMLYVIILCLLTRLDDCRAALEHFADD